MQRPERSWTRLRKKLFPPGLKTEDNSQSSSSQDSDVVTGNGQIEIKLEGEKSAHKSSLSTISCSGRQTRNSKSKPVGFEATSERLDDKDDTCSMLANFDPAHMEVVQGHTTDGYETHENATIKSETGDKGQGSSDSCLTTKAENKATDVVEEIGSEPPKKIIKKKSKFTQPTVYGFARGLKAKEIIGAGATGPNGTQLMFLMRWEGTRELDLVTAREANARCPEVVMDFYFRRLGCVNPPTPTV